MGLFDYITCKHHHIEKSVPGSGSLPYQTKDTPRQWMDSYEIREDGTLWHEEYDTEDQSVAGKWKRENPGKKPKTPFGFAETAIGMCTRVNRRWVQVPFRGEIEFHSDFKMLDGKVVRNEGPTVDNCGWISWSAYFVDGKLNQLQLLECVYPK